MEISPFEVKSGTFSSTAIIITGSGVISGIGNITATNGLSVNANGVLSDGTLYFGNVSFSVTGSATIIGIGNVVGQSNSLISGSALASAIASLSGGSTLQANGVGNIGGIGNISGANGLIVTGDGNLIAGTTYVNGVGDIQFTFTASGVISATARANGTLQINISGILKKRVGARTITIKKRYWI